MRVIPNEPPQERKTVIEFTDSELQKIGRALYIDPSNDDDNSELFDGIMLLHVELGLEKMLPPSVRLAAYKAATQ